MPTRTAIRTEVSVEGVAAAPFRDGAAQRTAVVLSAIVAVVMAVESLLGLLVANLYPEPTWAVAAFRGNDLVTLVLVTPIVVLSPLLVRRTASSSWALLWLAALLYNTYNFAYYVFGSAFNDVFLLHVASLSLSLIALVLAASSLDVGAVAAGIPWGTTTRVVAGFMMFVGLALVFAWGGLAVRFAITGELPENLMPPQAVHLVYAIDLSLLAPSFILGAVLLWRAVPWGYALGVIVNAFGFAYLVVLEVVGGFQANAGVDGPTWVSLPAIGGALLCALAVVALLRIRPARAGSATSGVPR